tara:strand:- start:82 stop:753 length:672 start_codon:yes stop_codon:yes gene_type:complete
MTLTTQNHSSNLKSQAYRMDEDTVNWLEYIRYLDPEEESGSFLTPSEIKEVEAAYARLAASGYGPPKTPHDEVQIFGDFEDYHEEERKSLIRDHILIKNKMKIAFLRALQRERTSLIDAITCEYEFELKIISYQRGYLSGTCKVLFPKAGSKIRNFHNEPGWKSEIEILYFDTREIKSHTIYARGLCMNAILSALYFNCEYFLNPDYEMDYSGIIFTPIAEKH